MQSVKRIVCLANSRKLSGRCLAGRDYTNDKAGKWIRPVSARPSEEVSEYERSYEDGTDPKLLDIIDITFVRAVPKLHQRENWLLDADRYWRRVGSITPALLSGFTENPATLWTNGVSTSNGLNDQVPVSELQKLNRSLYLIAPSEMQLHVFAPGAAFNNPKRRVQARFAYLGVSYWLWVTDPKIERDYLAQPNGTYQLGKCYVTASLGEAHTDGFAYKLVAAIIT